MAVHLLTISRPPGDEGDHALGPSDVSHDDPRTRQRTVPRLVGGDDACVALCRRSRANPTRPGYYWGMKREIQVQRGDFAVHASISEIPGPLEARRGRGLTLADRLAFLLLALGLLALGGVLLAAGAILLGAATGGLLIGGAVALWRRPGHTRGGLAPGEVLADARVLPPAPTTPQPDRSSSLPVVRGD
jgi:hypothetical protein